VSRESLPDGGVDRSAKYRVTVVTNGNFFSSLGLRELLESAGDDLALQVFVTTGLRRASGNRAWEAVQLLRRWGLRYAAYQVSTYVLPALGELVGRRALTVSTQSRRLGIPVHVTRNVNLPPARDMIRQFSPDLLVSFSCPYKIGDELLGLPRAGSLNVHSSLLPAYAGVCTYVHALAEGESTTGVTVHEMVSRFDAGRIVAQEEVAVEPQMSVFELFSRQCQVAAHLLHQAVRECLRAGAVEGREQDLAQRSYRREPTRSDIARLRARGHRLLRSRDAIRLLTGMPPVARAKTRAGG
jgi:folate-dependent phosphoribosylglycinamide formyltransferase PurN